MARTNLISNKHEWNNCFIKFCTPVYLQILAKFYKLLILQSNQNLMWQKQQQVGSHMACTPFVNLVEWKTWKRSTGLCWTKITIIYNLRNVYQTKDIHPWSESLKSVQVWVIEKSCNCALAHNSCKTTAENVDRHVTDVVTVKIIFDKNSISVPLSLLWLPWHQFAIELDQCVELIAGQFQIQGEKDERKYLSVGFIFGSSEATLVVLCGL